jgi:hypothetical protein
MTCCICPACEAGNHPLTGGFILTNSQKERINHMRQDGESYAAIADALGLSRNTVKSFCLRNTCVDPSENKDTVAKKGVCAQCGKGFTLCPGHRQRRFCSDQCRMVWWNAHRDLLKSNAKVENTCVFCGKHFMGYERQYRKYCSHGCYIAHRYKKELSSHE